MEIHIAGGWRMLRWQQQGPGSIVLDVPADIAAWITNAIEEANAVQSYLHEQCEKGLTELERTDEALYLLPTADDEFEEIDDDEQDQQ